jgi:hypothetical protein
MKFHVGSVIGRLSAMPNSSPIKRLLRTPLHFIPPGLTVPVVDGPLQGKHWIVGSSVHRCWIGTYDPGESRRMKRHLRPGSICFDVGAQAGYHTLCASSMVGSTGRVFAIEPAPNNVANIRKHIAMNHLTNVTVVEAAVGFGILKWPTSAVCFGPPWVKRTSSLDLSDELGSGGGGWTGEPRWSYTSRSGVSMSLAQGRLLG